MLNPAEQEREEIRRSAEEAACTGPALVPAKLVARYAEPPENTAFPLEYAFHLLGDVTGKHVLDYGCGSGGNALLLAIRGARVTGIDISPDLVAIARQHLAINNVSADLRIASAYQTGLPDHSADVVFCMGVLHHLDLAESRVEILRVLKPGGFLVWKEPIRDSRIYNFVRSLIPYSAEPDSANERPLKTVELDAFASGLRCEARRRFKLPFVRLAEILSPNLSARAFHADRLLLDNVPFLERVATIEVRKLRMPASGDHPGHRQE